MDEFICEYCLEVFKTHPLLLKHQKTTKYCLIYRDVIFKCKKCHLKTVGIRNIEKHLSQGDCEIICPNTEMNSEIIIENLKNALKIEKLKSSIFRNIIEQNIPIKLGNIITEDDCNIHINEKSLNSLGIQIQKNDLSIKTTPFVEILNQPKSPSNSEKDITETQLEDETDQTKIDNKIYKGYKVMKNTCIELSEEPDIEWINLKIKEVDLNVYNIKHSFERIDKCKIIFKETFESIRHNRSYVKFLDNLKSTRLKLIGNISFKDYTELLSNHIHTLKTILEEKGHQEKKIPGIIMKSLNSIDTRLVFYGNYFEIPINIEEIPLLKTCLDLSIKSHSYYVPFDVNEIVKLFFNYGTVLSSIKTCIESYLVNKYGFNNLVYVPIKHSTEEDPYSFYTLEAVVKDKRYWKMDCRLYDTAENISNGVKSYLVNVFRKIYYDIFKDNDFRGDYDRKSQVTGNDCDQLLMNIFTISNIRDFCDILRKIIIEKATYVPSDNDKFNIWQDDILMKKRFNNKGKDGNDIVDIVKLLFDNITSEQAVDLYRAKFFS